MRTMWCGCVVVMLVSVAAAEPLSAPDGRWAVVSAPTRAALSPDGPWLPRAIDAGSGLLLQRDSEPRLAIREEARGAEIVVYVDRATLRAGVTDDVELTPTPVKERAPEGPGLTLNSGTWIEVLAPAEHGLSKVRVVDERFEGLRITGFVPSAKIGTLYQRVEHAGGFERQDVTLAGHFQLLAAPGGAAFVIGALRDRMPAKVLERRGAFTLVQIRAGAVGWIATSQTRAVDRSKRMLDLVQPVKIEKEEACGWGAVAGPDGSCADPRNTVREKTPLFDAIDGREVGVVTSAFRYTPSKHERGWARFEVTTRFGPVALWAHLDAAAMARALRPPQPDPALETGDVNGVEGGVVGGDLNGVVAAPPPPPPPPPPVPPQNVAPTALEANRIRGTRDLPPDAATWAEIVKSGKTKLVGSFKLCVDVTGKVITVNQLKSTGFAAYDSALVAGVRQWAYRPFVVNGVAAPVCTAVTFVFELPPPPPSP